MFWPDSWGKKPRHWRSGLFLVRDGKHTLPKPIEVDIYIAACKMSVFKHLLPANYPNENLLASGCSMDIFKHLQTTFLANLRTPPPKGTPISGTHQVAQAQCIDHLRCAERLLELRAGWGTATTSVAPAKVAKRLTYFLNQDPKDIKSTNSPKNGKHKSSAAKAFSLSGGDICWCAGKRGVRAKQLKRVRRISPISKLPDFTPEA